MQNLEPETPSLAKFRSKIETFALIISSVGNLQLSVGKSQLPGPPTLLTHDAAA